MTAPTPPSASSLAQKIEEAENLRQLGDVEGSLTILDRLVKAHPKSARALNDKGICLRLLGQPARGAMELRKARKLAPESPEVLANLANCLRDQGEMDTAVKAYQKALQLRPDFAPVHGELGATYQAIGESQKAVACYEKSLGLNPNEPVTVANLASASLEVGDIPRALEMAERSLTLDPRGRRAMVVKSFALHELGREQDAAELLNLDFVRLFPQARAEGFESIAEFNRALAKHVMKHPTLEYEPANRSTTKGEQTGELLHEPKGPVAQLEEMIKSGLEEFLSSLPKDPTHPYLSHRPEQFRLNVWGTCLGAQGHQSHHIHPGGWVSGVYYVQLPPEMSGPEDGHEGWIQFGGVPDNCQLERERPLRLIEPKEGTLVMFPSYYYHRTMPFESQTKRISIAFDAIPVG